MSRFLLLAFLMAAAGTFGMFGKAIFPEGSVAWWVSLGFFAGCAMLEAYAHRKDGRSEEWLLERQEKRRCERGSLDEVPRP